jgi:putative intracellular protease/amidase
LRPVEHEAVERRAAGDGQAGYRLFVDGRSAAGVASKMPYNAEAEIKRRGALYQKALLPFVSYVVVDGRLVTGQNPWSAKATAEKVASLL